jgi:hypothetical protein
MVFPDTPMHGDLGGNRLAVDLALRASRPCEMPHTRSAKLPTAYEPKPSSGTPELPSERASFIRPEWLGREVTGEKRYSPLPVSAIIASRRLSRIAMLPRPATTIPCRDHALTVRLAV